MTASTEGKAGLLQGLAKAMKTDAALRAQMTALMSQSASRTASRLFVEDTHLRRYEDTLLCPLEIGWIALS